MMADVDDMDVAPSASPPTGARNSSSSSSPGGAADADASFDLEAYIANYTGHTRIARLLFVADHRPELEAEALRLAATALRESTTNTVLYRQVVERAGLECDEAWIAATDSRAGQELHKLELDLAQYRNKLIKESIRLGLCDVAAHHYHRGDLQQAQKAYARSRDYATSGRHLVDMCLNVIRVSVELGQFGHVQTHVAKAQQSASLVEDPISRAKLSAASGLAYLAGGAFKEAARQFVETSFELGPEYNDVIAPQDIATYGALCALVALERDDLRKRVLEAPKFRHYLELVPAVRELLHDFYNSRYSRCLETLERLRGELEVDLHMRRHVDTIVKRVRLKALVQYFAPFSTVDMPSMARAFNCDVAALETELTDLIVDGAITARIDSHNKVLHALSTDVRKKTLEQTLRTGERFEQAMHAALFRLSAIENGLTVGGRPSGRRGGGGGGGGGRGRGGGGRGRGGRGGRRGNRGGRAGRGGRRRGGGAAGGAVDVDVDDIDDGGVGGGLADMFGDGGVGFDDDDVDDMGDGVGTGDFEYGDEGLHQISFVGRNTAGRGAGDGLDDGGDSDDDNDNNDGGDGRVTRDEQALRDAAI